VVVSQLSGGSDGEVSSFGQRGQEEISTCEKKNGTTCKPLRMAVYTVQTSACYALTDGTLLQYSDTKKPEPVGSGCPVGCAPG